MLHTFGDQPDKVKIKIKCLDCKELIEYEGRLPCPDYSAEKSSDSVNINEECIQCYGCEKEYNIVLGKSFFDSYIEIYELDDDYDDEILEIETFHDYYDDTYYDIYDDIMINGSPKDLFDCDINEINQLLNFDNKTIDIDLKNLLYRQCFIAVITAMEAYLSSFLIKKVFSDDKKIFKGILKIIDSLNREKYSLSDLYNSNVEERVRGFLLGKVLYHDLNQVEKLYSVLSIEFINLDNLQKRIKLRHDLVHRGKKDKGDKLITVDRDDVLQVISDVTKLIDHIQSTGK